MIRRIKSPQEPAPKAVELVEEAVHLLRQAPASTWAVYAVGASLWLLGFLFFWAFATWFAPSDETLAWWGLGLTGLFVLLKACQAEFCARLLAQRLGAPAPDWSWRNFGRLALAQTKIQAWGVVLVPLSVALTVPFGWVYAYFQTATVLGAGDLHREAAAEARRWPAQNHLGLTLLSVVGIAVWINVASGFYAVPWLAKRLLGVENIFGFSGWWYVNTTFLASVTALTWMAVDPLIKAFYVLRVFYGRAQRTGEDLRVELAAASQARRARATAVAAILAALSFLVVDKPLRAADTPTPTNTAARVDPAQLDGAIERVLERRDFRWQMRPKPRPVAEGEKKAGPIRRFFKQGFEIVRTMIVTVRDAIRDAIDWLRDLIHGRDQPGSSKSSSATGLSAPTLRILLYGLMAALLILIVIVLIMMWRNRARAPITATLARAVGVKTPDLRDDQIEAAHLPTDGWLALAQEQMSKGEWRLALRALYLATLARLAADGFVTLVKSKTNSDYERELRRRAPADQSLQQRFAARRREFEEVWYGRGVAGEDRVRAWFDELGGSASR